jgi:hypothetical protein
MYSIDEKVKATIEHKNLAGSMFKGDVCSLGWSRNMFVARDDRDMYVYVALDG